MDRIEEAIFKDVKEILSRILKIKVNEITLASKLQDDLGVDSVDFWDVVASLEKRFKYRLTDKEAMALVTVSDLINALKKKVKA